jgi:hypothetical protein
MLAFSARAMQRAQPSTLTSVNVRRALRTYDDFAGMIAWTGPYAT